MAQYIDVDATGAMGEITIDRPDSLHALSKTILSELADAFDRLERESVRTIVLDSTGDTAFMAGADLKELHEMDSAREFSSFLDRQNGVHDLMGSHPAYIIAAVDGIAYGGGFELALAADMIVADADASFALPEVSRGMIPGGGGMQRLARIVGVPKAKELVATGTPISAETAADLGVVNRVADETPVREAAEELSDEILSNAPRAVETTKRSLRRGPDAPLDQAVERDQESVTALYSLPEAAEGIAAFVEDREPEFEGV